MSRNKFQVGSVVQTSVNVMGNPVGSIGLCYDVYPGGSSFIFQNGAADNFSNEDLDMLDFVGFSEDYAKYEFESITKVGEDFKDGKFDFDKLKSQFNIGA